MTKTQIKTKAHELKLKRTKGLNCEITNYIRKEYYNKGAEYIANRFNIPKSAIYTYTSKNKIPGKKSVFVRIVDVVYREKIAICRSIKETVKVMQEDYELNVGEGTINSRLTGKITTPYKGRFMFYYATDEEIKRYFEDGKVS